MYGAPQKRPLFQKKQPLGSEGFFFECKIPNVFFFFVLHVIMKGLPMWGSIQNLMGQITRFSKRSLGYGVGQLATEVSSRKRAVAAVQKPRWGDTWIFNKMPMEISNLSI